MLQSAVVRSKHVVHAEKGDELLLFLHGAQPLGPMYVCIREAAPSSVPRPSLYVCWSSGSSKDTGHPPANCSPPEEWIFQAPENL